MRSLVLADLRHTWRQWTWVLIAMTTASSCVIGLLVSSSTAMAHAATPEITEGLMIIGFYVVGGTILAASVIISAIAALSLRTRAREHALWIILGVPRRRVRLVLLLQMQVVALVAALLGSVPALVVARVGMDQWSGIGLAPPGLGPEVNWWEWPATLILVMVAALLGGWRPSRDVARTPEMAALRQADATPVRVGRARWLGAGVMTVLGLVMLGAVLTRPLGGADDRAAGALCAMLLLTCSGLMLGNLTLRPLLVVITRLLPSRNTAWFIASQTCRWRVSRSASTITPFAMALALVGVLLGGGNAMGGEVTMAEVLVLVGWVLLIAWVGGVALISLASRQRRTDSALLVATGASPGITRRVLVDEGLIYAATAIVHGLAAMTATTVVVAAAGSVPVMAALGRAPWLTFVALAALSMATTVAAVTLPSRTTSDGPLDALRS